MYVFLNSSEFLAAIAGATVGGVIAFAIQILVLWQARSERRNVELRRQQGLATSLVFKTIRVHSNILGMKRHIDECFAKAAEKGLTGEPWQLFIPLAGVPDRVDLTSDEMAMLLAQGDDDVFNKTLSLDAVHNGLVDAMRTLNDLRLLLGEKLQAESWEGTLLSGVLDRNQMVMLRPKMIQINSLIEELHASAEKESNSVADLLTELQALLRTRLDLKFRIELPSEGNSDFQTQTAH
ncbi:MAG: hypothetical protein ACPW61_06785 [Methyloligella sp. ZOD6]